MTLFMKNSLMAALVIIPLLLMNSAYAACYFNASSALKAAVNLTQPLLGGNITVGSEVPIGTIVYRQSYNPTIADASVTCDPVGAFKREGILTRTPLPLSAWGAGIYAGKVYETGVQGLGVAIMGVRDILPYTTPGCEVTDTCHFTNSASVELKHWQFDIYIIKTGPVAAGSISGLNIPCLSQGAGAAGNTLTIMSACFSGVLNVVSKTCTTPDVNVQLGTFDISRTFKGIGTAAPWKDASIMLTDCPRFYGTLNDGRNTFYSDNGTTGVGTFQNNVLNLLLVPNTAIINDANGIMGLKPGSDSATGVGIQIGYGNVGDASPLLVNFSNFKSFEVANTTMTAVRIPLVARYIQTESSVTPGIANATATFTINYY